uniref:Solute carrier family 10 (Sodium/bile acid cotransporter family), member 1 n=1 Tax=Nothobranchius pienaari TaxID=704102 RepID=A0A1A8LS12_9TELE
MTGTMNVTTGSVEITFTSNDSGIPGNGSVGILNIPKHMNTAINVLSIIILFITMISLGCTMEISKIKMDPFKAVTVLICGCCPGGSLSNIFSLLVNGDMNLSIVMTTCSSVAALGLMPLLLYVFSKGFKGLENAVPYAGILTALVSTLVPCAIGILINHYKPNYSPVVTKTGVSILIISTIIISALSGLVVRDVIWMIFMPDVLSVAALMPLIGFTLGYVMSVICRLSPQCSRTISMETGCQNIQLCTTILKVAFPPQVIGPMFLFPLMYITFQCSEALLMGLWFRCYQIHKSPAEGASVHKQEEVKLP